MAVASKKEDNVAWKRVILGETGKGAISDYFHLILVRISDDIHFILCTLSQLVSDAAQPSEIFW